MDTSLLVETPERGVFLFQKMCSICTRIEHAVHVNSRRKLCRKDIICYELLSRSPSVIIYQNNLLIMNVTIVDIKSLIILWLVEQLLFARL